MIRTILRWGACVTLLGCSPSPVQIELNFPSETAFAYSSLARVRVFRISKSELNVCTRLLAGLSTNVFPSEPIFDSQPTDVCNWLGQASLPEFGQGPHAYLVDVSAVETLAIMNGCAVGEIYTDAPPIRIELQPTNEYEKVLGTPAPTGGAAQRCGGST